MTKLVISNATGRTRECNYRMPGEPRRILKFTLAKYAFNVEVTFLSEDHLAEFKLQNGYLFEGKNPVLIEGKQFTKKKLTKVSKTLEEEAKKKMEEDIKSQEEQLSQTSHEATGKDLTIDVEKIQQGL